MTKYPEHNSYVIVLNFNNFPFFMAFIIDILIQYVAIKKKKKGNVQSLLSALALKSDELSLNPDSAYWLWRYLSYLHFPCISIS